ncbi:MAG: NAD(+)/NADH kinase, partial [Proteobacteria bacterium]|nr:NAD(+)/NADH kinase [Pseudomonadota bacterium]
MSQLRALVVSPTEPAQLAAEELAEAYEWVPVEQAEAIVALGGDGFMLQTLHNLLESRRSVPVFGMNLGTVGFL